MTRVTLTLVAISDSFALCCKSSVIFKQSFFASNFNMYQWCMFE